MRVDGVWAAAKHAERKTALARSSRVRIGLRKMPNYIGRKGL